MREGLAGGASIFHNMLLEAGQERVQAAYRDNDERLSQLKARDDPRNVFSVHQNIRPNG